MAFSNTDTFFCPIGIHIRGIPLSLHTQVGTYSLNIMQCVNEHIESERLTDFSYVHEHRDTHVVNKGRPICKQGVPYFQDIG